MLWLGACSVGWQSCGAPMYNACAPWQAGGAGDRSPYQAGGGAIAFYWSRSGGRSSSQRPVISDPSAPRPRYRWIDLDRSSLSGWGRAIASSLLAVVAQQPGHYYQNQCQNDCSHNRATLRTTAFKSPPYWGQRLGESRSLRRFVFPGTDRQRSRKYVCQASLTPGRW